MPSCCCIDQFYTIQVIISDILGVVHKACIDKILLQFIVFSCFLFFFILLFVAKEIDVKSELVVLFDCLI